MDTAFPHLHGEVGGRGGVAHSVATSVILDLFDDPVASVSGIFQTLIAEIDGHRYGGVTRVERRDAISVAAKVNMPLIGSWDELQRDAAQLGMNAAAAVA